MATPSELSNKLYYGDNLPILRGFPAEFVDLVYLDPPFNSNRDYNVIFKDEAGRGSDAQLLAFEDTWHWGPRAEKHYSYLTNTQLHRGRVPEPVSALVDALRRSIHENQMLAYLVEMTVRLVEMRRVLKPTGSLYLHCDPTASHYLKLILDAIFGPRNFRNEIIWQRFNFHADARRFGRVTDSLLFYSKSDTYTWNVLFGEHKASYLASHFKEDAAGRLYTLDNPLAKGQGPPRRFGSRTLDPAPGTHWRWDQPTIDRMMAEGTLVFTKTGRPRVKRYLDQMRPPAIHSLWTDIPAINSQAAERLGYPTQKPLALLERVISASSQPGDLVLDPFCGCGTALDAARTLGRQWLGIDITYLAIGVIRRRMESRHPEAGEIEVENRPTELEGARQMAASQPEGPYQFQWWALDEIGATPRGGVRRKGADEAVDGLMTFTDIGANLQTVIVSVKSGHPRLDDVRVLRDTVTQRQAAIGVLITLDEPTAKMRQDAAAAGFWHSELYDRDYLRLQILSAADLIEKGKRPDLPPLVAAPYRLPGRVAAVAEEQTAWSKG